MPLLQYLNGVIDVPQPFEGVTLPPDYPTVGVLGGLCDYDMAGLAAMATHSDLIDQVTGEHALDEYNGINGVEDCELLRSYLLKTKGVVDACPQMIQTYVNPEEFSNMLDYVLRYWDTDARETAVEKMASRELALIESGKVRIDDTDTDGVGGGFFNALWVCVRPQSELAQATQEVLSVYKGKLRNAAAYARENDGKVTAELLSGLSGMDDDEVGSTSLIYGWDYHDEQDGLSGEETITVADVVSPDVDYCERYLRNMYNMVSAKPSDFFAQEAEGQQFVNALGVVLDNFHSGKLDNVIAQLSNNRQFGGLFKKIGKAIKKAATTVGKGVSTAVKATGKGIANATKATGKGIANATKAVGKGVANAVKAVGKAFKKLGKKIAKVVKKVVKFLIRFNPLTACIRGILILAARFNWFKLAEKSYPGTFATYAEAKVKCATTTTTNGKKTVSYISEDYYKKCKDLYGKFKNVYTKIGGYESKLKSNLEKGSKKKWNGGEVTTASVSKASVKKLKDENGGDKAAQAEAETEFKAVEQTAANKKGSNYTLTEDSKIEVGTSKVEQKTVEVTANEYVTTQATNFYLETATDKVSCSIPKGTKLIIDATDKGVPILYDQTGENTKGTYYRTQYNNKYGIILKSCVKSTLSGLMGLDEYDESLCGFFSRRKKKKNQKQTVSTAKAVDEARGKTRSSSASNSSSTSKTSSLFSRIRSKMQSGVKTVVKKLPSSATTKAEATKNKNKVTAKTKKVVAKNTKTGQIGYVDQIEVIYDNNGHALGIWWDVAMAIASATSTLTGLVSAMLKAFGKDKAANALAITSAATGVAAVGFGVGSGVAAAKAAKAETSTSTAAKTSSSTAAKTSSSTAAKTSSSTAAKTSSSTAAKTSSSTAAKTSSSTAAKTSSSTAAKTSSSTAAKTSSSTAAKTSSSTAAKTSSSTAAKTSSSTAAKPITTTSTANAINNSVKSNISTVTAATNTVKNATSVANNITNVANKINNVASTTGANVTQAVVNTTNLVKQIKAEKQAAAATTTPQQSSTTSTNTTTTQPQAQTTSTVATSSTTDKKKLLTYGAIGLGSILILGLVLGGRRN